jgi:hypothetical protein
VKVRVLRRLWGSDVMKFRTIVAAVILAVAPIVANATTVVNMGNLFKKTYNAGNINLAADDYVFGANIIGGKGGFTANTYVTPYKSTGLSTAIISFFVKGSRFTSLTGSWGGNAFTFNQVVNPLTNAVSYVGSASVIYAQAGLAGAQLFKVNWTGGNDITFQVSLSAVPVPAAGLLMLGALGGLGAVARRRSVAAGAAV